MAGRFVLRRQLRLDDIGSERTSLYAGLIAGVSFALGAAVPIAVITAVPGGLRVELTFVAVVIALGLTGWFAARLTGLPVLRLVRRNLTLGTSIMAAGAVMGLLIGL